MWRHGGHVVASKRNRQTVTSFPEERDPGTRLALKRYFSMQGIELQLESFSKDDGNGNDDARK